MQVYNQVLPSKQCFGAWTSQFRVAMTMSGTLRGREKHNWEYIIYIYGSKSTIKRIIEEAKKTGDSKTNESDDEDEITTHKFSMYHRTGSYYRPEYKKLSFPIKLMPNEDQDKIVREIRQMMKNSVENGYMENLRVLLSGPSGSGKTTIAFKLAKYMIEEEGLNVSL